MSPSDRCEYQWKPGAQCSAEATHTVSAKINYGRKDYHVCARHASGDCWGPGDHVVKWPDGTEHRGGMR